MEQERSYIVKGISLYAKLYEQMLWPNFPGLGQAIGLVKDTGWYFMWDNTPQAAYNNISLSSGFFSKSTAQSDIDAGRPIVLGMHPFNNEGSFHVVTAYGYAKLDGTDGFLVHWGLGDDQTQVWVPSSWFAFQMRMSTTHTHTFTEGGNRNDTHRDLTCSVCGATSVDPLYNLSGETISGVRHTLSGSVTIPNSINIYNTSTASFASQSITAIGNSAFANQTQLSQITIPSSVISIGSSAFKNCTGLTTITLSNNLTSIGAYAFEGCTNLNELHIPYSVTNISKDALRNTNNIPIYINGRASVPSTFDVNWNSSGNPVYLNGSLCTHNSGTTLIKLNDALHGYLCNKCRTVTNKAAHTAGPPYTPFESPFGMPRHFASCICGTILAPCIGFAPPGQQAYCIYCGQPIDNLINRVYYDFDEMIDYLEQHSHTCCDH